MIYLSDLYYKILEAANRYEFISLSEIYIHYFYIKASTNKRKCTKRNLKRKQKTLKNNQKRDQMKIEKNMIKKLKTQPT